ncbi:protein NLRC5-like [Strongylocentrotus purpuratus]|uniref:NACHT domain-containing protein n=1 Tax=Strongylocentrotus purpuratus TaxID=7668 RepID=A0A7M7PEA9_STRPU|nr:protein NLRC5-like [Strongylocentrotus purpuratus]
MATQGGIADDLFFHLAEDIQMGEQMEALGRTLGFKVAEIDRYTETNNKGAWVYCKGTFDMLFDWRQTVVTCDQHLRLKQALIDAKLVVLADKHLKGIHIIPGIYNKKISASLTVERCREKLENKYRKKLCKIQMKPWDQSDYAELEDMHTAVTMVKKDANGQDTKKKEKLKGSEIFSTKVNGELPARILISAPAGRGKTTAVAKMAHDWVHRKKGSALEHLPLLFVVKFRNTSRRTSIGEAIKDQLLSDVDDLTPEGLEKFIRENQGICHIILDGLDEYAGISSLEGSSESNIFSVIRWEEFPECRVLVTTRPHLENIFNQDELPRVYTKMWIEGFSRESSHEYIDKFFGSTSNNYSRQGHGLKVYLDEQPLINELVKTPLFCLMVCHLWSEGLLNTEIATQTELLDSVNVFLMHHANFRSKSRVKITRKKLRKIICQLGKVALTGLLDDAKKLVFTPDDFRKVPAMLEIACELGIVSKTTASLTRLPQSNETTSTTIEFYHKLAQEHSAGKFLADQTNHFLLRLKLSKLDRVLLKIKANIGDYENLIRFAAGTDNNLCIRIMERVLANSFVDELERYRILLDCSSETKGTEGNVSSLVQRCVNAESIVLKSPTVYTVVGMQQLPKQLKRYDDKVRGIYYNYRRDEWTMVLPGIIFDATGQQHIYLTAPSSLPSEKNSVSRETIRGMGLLIREQTNNLQGLLLTCVKCTDEEDLVELVECCKNVETMNHLMLLGCGTNTDGRLSRHITGLHKSKKSLGVIALHVTTYSGDEYH